LRIIIFCGKVQSNQLVLIIEVFVTKQKRSQETRNHILESALSCFSKNGYDTTSVSEICVTAGVSKGAYYHHFPTKQAVFLALLNVWLGGLEDTLLNIIKEAGTVPEAFNNMAGMAQNIFTVARGKIPMFLEFWIQARRDPIIWEATIEPYRRYQNIFANLITVGIDEGTIKTINPQDVARIIVAFAVGLLLQGALDPDSADWGGILIQGIRIIIGGMESQ
jgi:AcrR family transcriptional regulator